MYKKLKFIDLFAGIGGIRIGFERVGYECVFSSEWDEYACKTYEANFGEKPKGDITKINPEEIPDHDILLGGFPCQPFSIIGAKEGFEHETQGTLFFNIENILKVKKPLAFMLENVRNLKAHDNGKTFNVVLSHLENLGYKVQYKVLNALDFGVPQKRERIIIVGFKENVKFEFPKPMPEYERKNIESILEPENLLDKSLYVKESIKIKRNEKMTQKVEGIFITHENVSGSITPHKYSCALRAGASSNYLLINNERKPSSRELLRLQGFPDTFKIVVPYSQIKKQTGNSVAVPVIEAVARQMKIAIDYFYGGIDSMDIKQVAKNALDDVIKKSRVHLYKPIQIAEILYRKRIEPNMDLNNLESYRSSSKKWRDDVSIELLGRKCTSSAKFQDDIFNAIKPEILYVLGEENNMTGGAVEAYIYRRFENKHEQLAGALDYCLKSDRNNFNIKMFIDSFWKEPGLKRSLDKVYEIVVFALFSTIINELELTVNVSINKDKINILQEFEDFTKNILNVDFSKPLFSQRARIYRVGVTNAADRGLDMYANWGPVIQIKHLALDEELAENIVDSVSSDKIIIVCKTAEKSLIISLLNQIGWKSKIQSIVTEDDLVTWYEKALRGKFAEIMGEKLLKALSEEIQEEFPSINNRQNIISGRKYEKITDEFWK